MSDLYIETRLQAIKDISSASCADIKDADNIASFCDEIYSAIPKIDKVVEELDCDRCENCSFLEVCAGSKCCTRCHEKIIEIVKQGGVSDDVCEWESDYKISDKYKIETGCGYTFYELRHTVPFKYCPYCGKKIKIVGD